MIRLKAKPLNRFWGVFKPDGTVLCDGIDELRHRAIYKALVRTSQTTWRKLLYRGFTVTRIKVDKDG
jgi:hypothetical protein